jgi:phosphoribosylamine-glycine ligase
MNIALVGTTAGTHFLAQRFLNEGHGVHFLNNNPAIPKHSNLKKYVHDEISDVALSKQNLLSSLSAMNHGNVDLIIPTQVTYQLWNTFREKIVQSKIPALLPSLQLAQYEWSKSVSKHLLNLLKIDTPKYQEYSARELINNFFKIPRPFVLKFNEDYRLGLQTLVVTDDNFQETYNYLNIHGNKKWQKGMPEFVNQTFIVEEFIYFKREYSYHALCNEKNWIYLGSARDYKKRFDNDEGHNTAGMGSYSPVEINPIVHEYQDRIYNFFKQNSISLMGVLYLGVAETVDGRVMILEINTRPGDPEMQSIFSLIDADLGHLFLTASTNKIIPAALVNNDKAVTIRIVRKDYNIHRPPQLTRYPKLVNVPENITVSFNSHFGLLHSTLSTVSETVESASSRLYNYLSTVDLGDYTVRTDIGKLL